MKTEPMKMTQEKLAEVLELHGKWLRGEENGERADLRYAVLRGAVLTGADLRGAVLTGADLRGAVLTGADLRGAILTGADLRYAVLRGAVLRDAVLGDAVYWDAVGDSQHIKSMQIERYDIAYTHDRLQIGCEQHAISKWWDFDDARIERMDTGALEWWRKWKPILQQIIEASPAEPTGAQEQETEHG